MGQIDDLVNGTLSDVKTKGLPPETDRKTLLSKVSTIIEVIGGIMIAIGVVGVIRIFFPDAREVDFVNSLGCIVGGISLLVYGLMGKCLDDIRKNTSPKA